MQDYREMHASVTSTKYRNDHHRRKWVIRGESTTITDHSCDFIKFGRKAWLRM